MVFAKDLLGKIFISHSSVDKLFVRKLATRLKKEGYQIWLDERELIVGDPIAEKISKALASSKVVLVIVSAASVKSKWLSFELNKATERMVQGYYRVIPVIKEKVELPSEVKGLLYADFSLSFKDGIKSVLTALEHESNRRVVEQGFWSQIEVLLEKVFKHKEYVFTEAEYNSKDYKVVYLDIPNNPNSDISVAYEIVSVDTKPVRPLRERWWEEYSSAIEELPKNLFLLITERPVEFATDPIDVKSKRLLLKSVGYNESVIIVDLASVAEYEKRFFWLTLAKKILIKLVQDQSK